jgi:hypothetical protein
MLSIPKESHCQRKMPAMGKYSFVYFNFLFKNSSIINLPQILTEEEQEGVRLASRLGREVLDEAARAIAPGVTTDEVDRVVHEACIERLCVVPLHLFYYPYPLYFFYFF